MLGLASYAASKSTSEPLTSPARKRCMPLRTRASALVAWAGVARMAVLRVNGTARRDRRWMDVMG